MRLSVTTQCPTGNAPVISGKSRGKVGESSWIVSSKQAVGRRREG